MGHPNYMGNMGMVRLASLLAVSILCLGIFLYSLYPHQPVESATGPRVSTAPAVGHPSYTAMPEGGHTLPSDIYLAGAIDEVEPTGKTPVNAGHLTALLLTVFWGFFVLLKGGKRWRRKMALLLAERCLPSSTGSCASLTSPAFLSVFIL